MLCSSPSKAEINLKKSIGKVIYSISFNSYNLFKCYLYIYLNIYSRSFSLIGHNRIIIIEKNSFANLSVLNKNNYFFLVDIS